MRKKVLGPTRWILHVALIETRSSKGRRSWPRLSTEGVGFLPESRYKKPFHERIHRRFLSRMDLFRFGEMKEVTTEGSEEGRKRIGTFGGTQNPGN
jgi:hypothetical protein